MYDLTRTKKQLRTVCRCTVICDCVWHKWVFIYVFELSVEIGMCYNVDTGKINCEFNSIANDKGGASGEPGEGTWGRAANNCTTCFNGFKRKCDVISI